MSLADPAVVAGERMVNVWAEVGHEKRAIGTLSSKQPVVSVPRVVLGGEFVLRHDLPVPDAVHLNVRILGATASSSDDVEDEEEETVIVLGKDEEHDEEETGRVPGEDDADETATKARVEYEPMSEEDAVLHYNSDNESSIDSVPLMAAPAGSVVVVPDGKFLGPARLAAAGNTAGIMRIAATEATGDQESKEIIVLYRYTRFSRPRSGRRGVVEACRRTKLHRLRFTVPRAGDLASSLAWAGSSLGPLIYPGLFRGQLQDLWTSLLAAPAIDTVQLPPRAARLQVIVDVGILRRGDYTAERMVHMQYALATQVLRQAWPACYYHVVMELHLPEPVPTTPTPTDGRTDDDQDEECCICFESLQESSGGVAAWPGCGHVFHGSCVEKTLARSDMCPLCRHRLSDPLVQKIEHQDPSIGSRALGSRVQ